MIKVEVVSGFLGAGKTTFINKRLKELKEKFSEEKIVLIENEFGEISIDSEFIVEGIKIEEISSGCICCVLKENFRESLEKIIENDIDRIIIEPTGLGMLGEILKILKSEKISKKCEIASVTTVIDGKLYGTSTAAGPAFEGMNIECGMRAGNGAVEGFEIVETGKFKMKTIGETPTGICESGLLDIMSEFVKHKIVLKSGKFNPRMKDEFKERLREKKFYISENIYLSQGDIRQIQLAKGAIAAGVKLLLGKVEKDISHMDEVIIAGSFGYHLNSESILNIGIISDFDGKISFAGNTSLNGCIGYLVNKKMREKIRTTEIDVMELSKSAKFQEVFIKELAF